MKRAVVGVGTASLLAVFMGVGVVAADDLTDVSGTTHEEGIRAVIDAGVAQGYPDGTFRPSEDVTRGQMARFLQRALDLPDADPEGFSDVAGTTHEDAVDAVVAAGIAGGFADGTFRPGDAVTRGQMARFLTNGLGLPSDDTVRFLDVEGTTHSDAIRAVSGAGVAGGFGDGTYGPGTVVTRGQMATFLARGLELIDRIAPPELPEPPEPGAEGAAAWGTNYWGQLGDGNQEVLSQSTPVTVSSTWSGRTVEMLDGGVDHTCATVDGQVYCWGYNQWGQLGDGTTTTRFTPTPVDTSGVLGGRQVTDLAIGRSMGSAGAAHTCVVADGAVYCWGENASGRLGDGTERDRISPVAVGTSGALNGVTVAAVAAGVEHTCVVADGEPYCWGDNFYGQLGWGFPEFGLPDEDRQASSVPVSLDERGDLPDGAPVTAIAASEHSTCVIADGSVYCWGDVTMPDGTSRISSAPVALDPDGALADATVTQIAAGPSHTCVVADGAAYCWGGNQFGQLGDGSEDSRGFPVAVDTSGVLANKEVTDIAAGLMHTCAIADGAPYCWGYNGNGQLGDGLAGAGIEHSSSVPVAVDTTGVLEGATAVRVAAGATQSYVTIDSVP